MICLLTKFHIPSSNGSLAIAIKINAYTIYILKALLRLWVQNF
jgi:hypothetical protein